MDKGKVVFWNVDTQKDFMNSDGKLYVGGAEEIVGNLAKLTQIAKENELTVVNTADWHNPDSKELSNTPDFMNTFPPHCMVLTDGAEFIDATNPFDPNKREECPYIISWGNTDIDVGTMLKARKIVIYKDAFDVFAGNPFTNQVVEAIKPDVVVVYGVATNVCVNCAVVGLTKFPCSVIVVTDAIKGLPNLPVDNILADWKLRGAQFMTTAQVAEMVKEAKMQDKIPTNLSECFAEFDRKSRPEDLEKWKKEPEDEAVCSLHFTSGMVIRNHWGLWGKNPLTKYFNSIGIFHADDMSSIIYTSYHRYLNGKDIKLKEQVKKYLDYWKAMGFKDGNPCNHSPTNYKQSSNHRFIIFESNKNE
jgi:nicotinamidase/pyrazinamidase